MVSQINVREIAAKVAKSKRPTKVIAEMIAESGRPIAFAFLLPLHYAVFVVCWF